MGVLRADLAADPGIIIEKAAKERGVTLRTVVEALPEEMRRFAPGEAFIEVMGEVAKWGDVTVIIHTEDGVMEFSGPVPEGKVGQGYYNLAGSKGFHGHLRHDRCAGVGFIERPFFGRPSASILFFNLEGGVMFKVFVGRDEQRNLKEDQLAAFRAIANKVCKA
ncbi:MAG: heme utilization cystosolic carrier protein HutX [Pseudomonadota bacterium]